MSKKNDADAKKALQLLQEIELQNLKLCSEEILESLQKYECGMIPEMLFRGTKFFPKVLLVTPSGMAAPLRLGQPIQSIQQSTEDL